MEQIFQIIKFYYPLTFHLMRSAMKILLVKFSYVYQQILYLKEILEESWKLEE